MKVIRALAHPTYRRLFIAQVVALAGTGLATVALGLLAFDLQPTSAGQVLGTVFAIKMIAYVLLAPVAAAVAARLPRRATLIGSDLVRLAVAVSLPFVGQVWQVYLLVFVLQAASATFTPLFQSLIPEVLTDEDDYTVALSLSRLAYDLEAVLSPVLAAGLLLLIPSSTLFFGTAAGFAASAALLLSATFPTRPTDTGPPKPEPFLARVRHGAVLFLRIPQLQPVLALNLAVAGIGAFVLVQTVVIVRTVLNLGDGTVALMLAVNGGGSMLAALTLPALLRRRSERRVMLSGAAILAAAALALPLALSTLSGGGLGCAVAVLWLLIGIGSSSVLTPIGRIIRRTVDPNDLPAAFAAQFSLSHACWLITYPLAGWLGTTTLTGAAATLAGITTTAAVIAVYLWPSRLSQPADADGLRS